MTNQNYNIMTDFLIWTLIIILTFFKCIFFALASIFIWIMIKKYSPKTSEKISNYGKNIKSTVKDTFNTTKEDKEEDK